MQSISCNHKKKAGKISISAAGIYFEHSGGSYEYPLSDFSLNGISRADVHKVLGLSDGMQGKQRMFQFEDLATRDAFQDKVIEFLQGSTVTSTPSILAATVTSQGASTALSSDAAVTSSSSSAPGPALPDGENQNLSTANDSTNKIQTIQQQQNLKRPKSDQIPEKEIPIINTTDQLSDSVKKERFEEISKPATKKLKQQNDRGAGEYHLQQVAAEQASLKAEKQWKTTGPAGQNLNQTNYLDEYGSDSDEYIVQRFVKHAQDPTKYRIARFSSNSNLINSEKERERALREDLKFDYLHCLIHEYADLYDVLVVEEKVLSIEEFLEHLLKLQAREDRQRLLRLKSKKQEQIPQEKGNLGSALAAFTVKDDRTGALQLTTESIHALFKENPPLVTIYRISVMVQPAKFKNGAEFWHEFVHKSNYYLALQGKPIFTERPYNSVFDYAIPRDLRERLGKLGAAGGGGIISSDKNQNANKQSAKDKLLNYLEYGDSTIEKLPQSINVKGSAITRKNLGCAWQLTQWDNRDGKKTGGAEQGLKSGSRSMLIERVNKLSSALLDAEVISDGFFRQESQTKKSASVTASSLNDMNLNDTDSEEDNEMAPILQRQHLQQDGKRLKRLEKRKMARRNAGVSTDSQRQVETFSDIPILNKGLQLQIPYAEESDSNRVKDYFVKRKQQRLMEPIEQKLLEIATSDVIKTSTVLSEFIPSSTSSQPHQHEPPRDIYSKSSSNAQQYKDSILRNFSQWTATAKNGRQSWFLNASTSCAGSETGMQTKEERRRRWYSRFPRDEKILLDQLKVFYSINMGVVQKKAIIKAIHRQLERRKVMKNATNSMTMSSNDSVGNDYSEACSPYFYELLRVAEEHVKRREKECSDTVNKLDVLISSIDTNRKTVKDFYGITSNDEVLDN